MNQSITLEFNEAWRLACTAIIDHCVAPERKAEAKQLLSIAHEKANAALLEHGHIQPFQETA